MSIDNRRQSILRASDSAPFGEVLVNWAALVALWALPYLTLLEFLRLDAARSEVLQWSLVIVGASASPAFC